MFSSTHTAVAAAAATSNAAATAAVAGIVRGGVSPRTTQGGNSTKRTEKVEFMLENENGHCDSSSDSSDEDSGGDEDVFEEGTVFLQGGSHRKEQQQPPQPQTLMDMVTKKAAEDDKAAAKVCCSSSSLEHHPHQLLSVHRKTSAVCRVVRQAVTSSGSSGGGGGNNNNSAGNSNVGAAMNNGASGNGDVKHKKSMVEEMLEDFPEINNDGEYNATFTYDVDMGEILCLDVGGDRYHVRRGCLTHLPNTRLGRLARCATMKDASEFCDIAYDKRPPEYFFDRNGDNFSSILDIYRTNMFHLSSSGCALVLQKDLEYWGIDELMMEPCCALKYYPEIEICVNEKQGDIKQKEREKEQAAEEDFGLSRWGLVRTWLWNTMEYPWTSKLAQFVAFASLGMVILSTLTFIMSTMEEFQAMDAGQSEYTTVVVVLDYIDMFAIAFFTVEYFVRFVCAPRKWRFFKNPMNMVDLFAIIPFYLSIFLNQLQDIQIIGKAGKIVRLIRVMRILRIFKLVRHFAGLQSLFFTLRQAYKELGLLMLLVAVAILTFSSLVYFAEKEGHDSSSGKINAWTFVESFWWGLMTITTVGYDLNPQTFLGKLIGGFCALCGIFILTLPIPIVVNSFASYYKNRLWRNEVAQKKRERSQVQAAESKEMSKFFLLKTMAAAPMGVGCGVGGVTRATGAMEAMAAPDDAVMVNAANRARAGMLPMIT